MLIVFLFFGQRRYCPPTLLSRGTNRSRNLLQRPYEGPLVKKASSDAGPVKVAWWILVSSPNWDLPRKFGFSNPKQK